MEVKIPTSKIREVVNDRNDEHCGLSLSGSASERL